MTMSLITVPLDWLASLTEPYWLTLYALGGMIADAGAGTTLFAGFVLLLSLDFLRSSKEPLIPVARAFAIASSAFFIASFIYGDFLAGPAKAAYTAIVARSEPVTPDAVVLSTLGVAGAGAFYYAGRRHAPARMIATPPQTTRIFAQAARRDAAVAALGRELALDAAGRLQLRQMNRNSKKAVNDVRPAGRGTARAIVAYGGRPTIRFDKV
jgi:hypothetical protein